MTSMEEALNGLYKVEADLLEQLEAIRLSIQSITHLSGGSNRTDSPTHFIQHHPQLLEKASRQLTKDWIDSLTDEGYNPLWNNTNKILYFLSQKKTPVWTDDLKKELKLHEPELKGEKLKKDQYQIGYQAGKLAKKAFIPSKKIGKRVQYWLPSNLS